MDSAVQASLSLPATPVGKSMELPFNSTKGQTSELASCLISNVDGWQLHSNARSCRGSTDQRLRQLLSHALRQNLSSQHRRRPPEESRGWYQGSCLFLTTHVKLGRGLISSSDVATRLWSPNWPPAGTLLKTRQQGRTSPKTTGRSSTATATTSLTLCTTLTLTKRELRSFSLGSFFAKPTRWGG